MGLVDTERLNLEELPLRSTEPWTTRDQFSRLRIFNHNYQERMLC